MGTANSTQPPTPVWGGSMGSLAQQGTTPSQPSMPVPGQYDGTGGTPDVFGGAYSSQPAQTTPAVTPPQYGQGLSHQGTPDVFGPYPSSQQGAPIAQPPVTYAPGSPGNTYGQDVPLDQGWQPPTLPPGSSLPSLKLTNGNRDQLAQLLMIFGGGRQQ